MSDERFNYWFVVLAVDREAIRGLIEGVVPASYKPPSTARWCMCKAESQERAIELAKDSFLPDLVEGETLHSVSVAQLWNPEVIS